MPDYFHYLTQSPQQTHGLDANCLHLIDKEAENSKPKELSYDYGVSGT